MSVLRLLGIPAVLFLLLGVAACGGDEQADREADQDKVAAAEREVTAVIDGVLREVAEDADMPFEAAHLGSAICGESYAPRGVSLRGFLRLGSAAELPDDDVQARLTKALEGDGWTITTPFGPLDPKAPAGVAIMGAEKGDLLLHVEAAGQLQVTVSNECVELSDDDLSRELGARKNAPITWN